MGETESRIKQIGKISFEVCRDQPRHGDPSKKKKKHIRLHSSFGGAAVASVAGTASSGVGNCGLESESILSGLPLPHESSRMICATPGRLGLVSG